MDVFLDFVLFLMAAVGLSHLLADGSIFAPFKFWLNGKGWFGAKIVEMMNCYQCNGFWSGLVLALLAWAFGYTILWYVVLWPLAISIISPIVGYVKLYAMLVTSEDYEEEPDEGDDEHE